MNNRIFQLSLIVTLVFSSISTFAKGGLRFSCSENGATIYINQKKSGICPADIFVEPGKKHIRVVKVVDSEHIQVFESHIDVVDGSVMRVDAELSKPVLSPAAKNQRVDAAIMKAKAGDTAAMKTLAGYYTEGFGVEKSKKQADFWLKKIDITNKQQEAAAQLTLARSGDLDAMLQMELYYLQGEGVEKDAKKADHWGKAAAKKSLELAEAGDITQMEVMVRRFTEGNGVEKSSEQADAWQVKVNAAIAKETSEEYAAQRKEDLTAELKELDRKELDWPYSMFVVGAFDMISQDIGSQNLSSFTITVAGLPFLTVMDLTLVAPIGSTVRTGLNKRRKEINEELNARASRWANPDSMITQAYPEH